MMSVEDMRRELDMTLAYIQKLEQSRQDLQESIERIEIDLDNNLQAFVATTGRPPADYYPWRKNAKWAMFHRRRAKEDVEKRIASAKEAHMRLQLLLYSAESQYDGESTMELLRALYYLLMESIERHNITLDKGQVGLIATVRVVLGHGVPAVGGGEHDG